MDFEWDDKKATSNYSKHGVRFTEAVTIWYDKNSLEISDIDHSEDEDRWIRLGTSQRFRLLVVVYVEKLANDKIRIISARKAHKNEQAQYIEGLGYEK